MHTKLLIDCFKALQWRHGSASTACNVGQIRILLSAQNRISVLSWLPWQCSLATVDSQPKHSRLTSLSLPVMEQDSPCSSELRKGIHALPRKNTSCMMHQCCLLLTKMHVLHVAVHVHQQNSLSMPDTQRARLFCRLKAFRTSGAPGSSAKLRRNIRVNVWDLIACAGAHCSHQRMCIGTPMQCPLSRQSNLAIKAATHIGLRIYHDSRESCCRLELCFISSPLDTIGL